MLVIAGKVIVLAPIFLAQRGKLGVIINRPLFCIRFPLVLKPDLQRQTYMSSKWHAIRERTYMILTKMTLKLTCMATHPCQAQVGVLWKGCG